MNKNKQEEQVFTRGIPRVVAYNKDTRSSDEQAGKSVYVLARASQLIVPSVQKIIGLVIQGKDVKHADVECNPSIDDAYAFGVGENADIASQRAIETLLNQLGFIGKPLYTRVTDTQNAIVFGGDQRDKHSRFYFTAIQTTTKAAIESLLNVQIEVTPYDCWSAKPLSDTLN